ncbi:hypothetical protein SAMN03159353_101880 [Cedecea sp. NFIX57]|nr:hypothetical protein SAMN03159353_101880 [Cedecea sp. NFIX57]
MQGNIKLYSLFIGLIVTIMITCDTLVYKVFNIYGLKITASGIVFSLYFLISTIITEVYGYKLSVRAVWIMVLCQTLYVLILNSISVIQPENNELASNYYHLYHEFWRVMVGTWISVPVSYFINGFIISKMKVVFSGKYFFMRYMIGSMSTQAALLLTAYPISLSGKYSMMDLLNIISTTWTYKVIMSIVLLPLAIIMVGVIKKIEKTDHYDWGISYNPFK